MYGVEQYIAECIESILGQSETSFELILVDDGSRDSSASIAESYAATDERVRVIRQANAGVSSARNRGLAVASGEFVSFVDGDDVLAPDFLETMLRLAGDRADMVISTRAQDTTGSSGLAVAEPWPLDRALAELTYAEIPMGCWNKIYRLSTLRRGDLLFLPRYQMGEGLNFITMAARLSQGRIYATAWSGYFYRRDNGSSATKTLSSDKMMNALDAIDNMRRDHDPVGGEFLDAIIYQVARTSFSGLVSAVREGQPERARLFRSRLLALDTRALRRANVPLARRAEVLAARMAPNLVARLRVLQRKLGSRH